MSSGCGGAAQSPMKGQMSSSKNASIKIHIPYGGIQKTGRQKLYIKKIKKRKRNKNSMTGGMKKGTKGKGGWTDLWREKSETQLDLNAFK